MVQQERIPVIRALVDSSLVIGAIITEESAKASWKLTTGAIRFAGRQTLQTTRRVAQAADMRRDVCTKVVKPVVSQGMAVANFVDALASSPDKPEYIEDSFHDLADKLKSIPTVTDGIRVGEELVPSEEIARGFLDRVVTLADKSGVLPEAAAPWIETLHEVAGIEPLPPPDTPA